MFGALSSISMWMAVGLVWWLPKHIRPIFMTGTAGYFAVVAALTPFLVIAPMYTLPSESVISESGAVVGTFEQPRDESGAITLAEASVLDKQVSPEGYVTVSALWRVDSPLSADWSIFVHLVTPDGVIIGQRDIYPGGGLLATSDLEQGRSWLDTIDVWIPATAYAPMTLDVEIGWYDLQTGERMRLADGAEILTIGQVELLPRPDYIGCSEPDTSELR